MQNPKIVLPSIYRFTLEGHPRESQWGWHRATELCEAMNNILELKGHARRTPIQFSQEFPFIKLGEGNRESGFNSPVVDLKREFGETSIGSVNWFCTVVKSDMYIPAKVGMQFLNAVKHPIRTAIKKMLSEEEPVD